MKRGLEVYIHIPFCVKKCDYCDFLSGPGTLETQKAYFSALRKELQAASDRDCQVDTVFIGGGTPSCAQPEEIAGILEEVRKNFLLSEQAEISMEANPGTLTGEKLAIYRQAGINRLSIGCQSLSDRELKELGRIHTVKEFEESFYLAREAGFTNINVDLMSGIPGQTLQSWEENLLRLMGYRPEHISAYSLIVEEGTPFACRNLDLPDEETERMMYERTGELLGQQGYQQYEISNYAKKGFACRHNIGYWERKEYLGFGLGAASLWNKTRFANTGKMETYLENSGNLHRIRKNKEVLDQKSEMEEFLFLRLRMTKGISEADFEKYFHLSLTQVYKDAIQKHEALGLLKREQGRLFLTRKGISLSNQVFVDFLLDEEWEREQ